MEEKMTYNANEMPHNGDLLKKYVEKSGMTKHRIAQKMGITTPSLLNYYKRSTIHTKALWNASLALERNLFLDLGYKMPLEYISDREKELQSRIEELEKEIAVYEKVLGGLSKKFNFGD